MIETSTFRRISAYPAASSSDFPRADDFLSGVPAKGTWPVAAGAPGRTSRSNEDLPARSWTVDWDAPLGSLSDPAQVLVGAGLVLVDAARGRALFDLHGRPAGGLPRISTQLFIDVPSARVLTAAGESGSLTTYRLPAGEREASVPLAFPMSFVPSMVLPGPDRTFVVVRTRPPTHAKAPSTAVDLLLVRDWGDLDEHGFMQGVEPLAGWLRENDDNVHVAVSTLGPVLASAEGLLWMDWQLRPVHETLVPQRPLGVSVDDEGRAFLLSLSDDRQLDLRILKSGAPAPAPTHLPVGVELEGEVAPPIVPATGPLYIVQGPDVLAVDRDTGTILWHQSRPSGPPGTVTADGQLLLADSELYALDATGKRTTLWKTRATLVTAPILAGGRIYVATAKALYALRPVD